MRLFCGSLLTFCTDLFSFLSFFLPFDMCSKVFLPGIVARGRGPCYRFLISRRIEKGGPWKKRLTTGVEGFHVCFRCHFLLFSFYLFFLHLPSSSSSFFLYLSLFFLYTSHTETGSPRLLFLWHMCLESLL